VHPPRGDPFDVFTTRAIVNSDQAAASSDGAACRLAFPS
jgi:hypothetical protein